MTKKHRKHALPAAPFTTGGVISLFAHIMGQVPAASLALTTSPVEAEGDKPAWRMYQIDVVYMQGEEEEHVCTIITDSPDHCLVRDVRSGADAYVTEPSVALSLAVSSCTDGGLLYQEYKNPTIH